MNYGDIPGEWAEVKLQLEVQTIKGLKVKVIEKDSRTFLVRSLVPGTKYEIELTAKNKHGSSKQLYLDVETFLLPSELIAETKVMKESLSDDQTNSVFQVTIAGFTILVITVVLVMIFFRLRTRTNLSSPVVSMTLLPKKNSVEHRNLATNLASDQPLLYTPENSTNNQVKHLFSNNEFLKLRKGKPTGSDT